MKDIMKNKGFIIIADAEIKEDTMVEGVLWEKGDLLELIKVVEITTNGCFIEVVNATLGGKRGIVDSEKLVIRHWGRYKLLQMRFLGDATLLDATKVVIPIPEGDEVGWKDGDNLELVRVEKRVGKKHFEFEVVNITQGSERALVSNRYIKINNERKFNSLILKYFK